MYTGLLYQRIETRSAACHDLEFTELSTGPLLTIIFLSLFSVFMINGPINLIIIGPGPVMRINNLFIYSVQHRKI